MPFNRIQMKHFFNIKADEKYVSTFFFKNG